MPCAQAVVTQPPGARRDRTRFTLVRANFGRPPLLAGGHTTSLQLPRRLASLPRTRNARVTGSLVMLVSRPGAKRAYERPSTRLVVGGIPSGWSPGQR